MLFKQKNEIKPNREDSFHKTKDKCNPTLKDVSHTSFFVSENQKIIQKKVGFEFETAFSPRTCLKSHSLE